MPKRPNGGIPQKINVHDPAAIAAAGFGDPNQQFNPEAELAASESDAAMVSAFNQANQVPKAPVSAPPPAKKVVQPAVNKPAMQVPVPQVEEEEELSEEEGGVFKLSDDPVKRLEQTSTALKEIDPSAPLPEQHGQWKQMHGDLFVLYLFDRAFVYRYLKRAEWIKMNLDESFQKMTQDQIEEYIFDRCTLWPASTVIEKNKFPAGLIQSLSEQIRINSMFIDPNSLSRLTVKL